MKILLVDDETKLLEALSYTLKKNAYLVDIASDGDTGLELALSDVYDIIVLDWMLPKRNGMEILQEIRKHSITTPVLFLTARDSAQERVAGLDAGADDYLIKPFSKEELLARLRALARRQRKELINNTITVGNLTLNPMHCEATCKEDIIRLTVKESLLLELLMRNAGQVLTKERILYKVWSYSSDIELANVDLYIHYLRKKLPGYWIRTVRGVGYCLQEEADVSQAPS
ncbi:MAG: response regulator transcription factor [Negativicutes bacterium]